MSSCQSGSCTGGHGEERVFGGLFGEDLLDCACGVDIDTVDGARVSHGQCRVVVRVASWGEDGVGEWCGCDGGDE